MVFDADKPGAEDSVMVILQFSAAESLAVNDPVVGELGLTLHVAEAAPFTDVEAVYPPL
jgi:hypothetical protein